MDSDFNNPNHRFVYLLYTYELRPDDPDKSESDDHLTKYPMSSRLTRVKIGTDGRVENAGPGQSPEQVLVGADGTNGPCPATPSNADDCIPSDRDSHSIGSVRSAPDGTLYFGSGDASDYGTVDPMALRTYDERSFAGKIMHVDREGRGLASHPFCPGDQDLSHTCTKLHAKGFRNPFRFQLRPGGGLVVADVGWTRTEEIDLINSPGGGNYGWPCYEGGARSTSGYQNLDKCKTEYGTEGTATAHAGPDFSYEHEVVAGEAQSASVIGGPEYTGNQLPEAYSGNIFYGDYALGFLKRLVRGSDGRYTEQPFATDWLGTDIAQSPKGDLVYVNPLGSVRRIETQSPRLVATASPTFGTQNPFTVQVDASGSSNPQGGALTYDWDFGDGTAHSTLDKPPAHTYDDRTRNYTATITVRNKGKFTATKSFLISPGNTPPDVQISYPADGSGFTAGATVSLSGSASDAQDNPDGTAPADGMTYDWDARLIHGAHTHFLSAPDGRTSSFKTLSTHDADSYYVVNLTVTDTRGLSDTASVTIRPSTVAFSLKSSPPDAPLSYAGRAVSNPFSTRSAVGLETTISAAATYARAGRTYAFDRWSDTGGKQNVRDLTIPARDTAITAVYRDTAPTPPKGSGGATGSPTPTPNPKPNAGPRLSFDPRRGLIRGRRVLHGKASDPEGVRMVEIAVGRRLGKSRRCRWISKATGRLAKRSRACARPH